MADVTPARNNIQVEETQYKAAVSEAVGQKIGGAINFINTYITQKFYFGVSGPFDSLTLPYTDFGYQEVFPFDAEIVNVYCRYGVAGTSGTSEIDIEWAADNSGTWASIFSTTPKVAHNAADNGVFDADGVSTTPANCTQPVLSKTTFDAGDKLRCILESAAVAADGFILVIEWRPR